MQRVLLLVVLVIAGCGGGSGKQTAQVQGTVTLDGAPMPGAATVTFEPVAGGKMAIGYVQQDGSFVLKTYQERDGAIVGKHRVSVSPVIPFTGEDAEAPAEKNPIPEKYRSSTTSGFEFEVKPETVNEFKIELTSK